MAQVLYLLGRCALATPMQVGHPDTDWRDGGHCLSLVDSQVRMYCVAGKHQSLITPLSSDTIASLGCYGGKN